MASLAAATCADANHEIDPQDIAEIQMNGFSTLGTLSSIWKSFEKSTREQKCTIVNYPSPRQMHQE